MKLSLLLLLISISLFASTEQKIIIGSYPTQKHAESALKKFESKLSSKFIAKQEQSYFNIVARPSGKTFIVAIEPFENYKEASALKAMLPRMYADAFINKYVPPAVKIEAEAEAEIKTEAVAKPEVSTKQLQSTAQILSVNTELPETTVETPQKEESNVTLPQSLDTKMLNTIPLLVPLEYFLGVSIIVLIFLLLFIKFYRKHQHLKGELKNSKTISDDHSDEKNNLQKTAKSSDIFFIR